MRKIYKILFIFILGLFHINTYSQICNIDYSYTQPGIYPDSMPTGYVGQLYNEDITFVMPLDTMGATITNFNIVNLALPVGLNWECNNSSNGCNYNPQNDQYGCVNIFGTPMLAGNYDIEVSILVDVVASGQTLTNIPVSFFVFMEITTGSPGGGNTGFTMSNTSGCSPVTIDFNNNNLGQLAYYWDFGNGNTSTLENPPSQQYNSPGQYIVTYEAYNNLDTIDLYTLTSVSILSVTESWTGAPWGWELLNGNEPDPYFILYENGTLIYQSNYEYNNDGPITWTMNITLDPNNSYEIAVVDADESAAATSTSEFTYGADDFIGSHVINFGGCGNCNAGSYADVGYNIDYQQIYPVPSIQSIDTINIHDYPGQPNINFDPVNFVLSTDSSQYGLQWYANDTIMAGHTNPTDTIIETGYYHVVAFNNFGCATSSDTIFAVYCDTNIIASINMDVNLDLFTTAPTGWTFQWYDNGNLINGATNDTYTPNQSGNYTVVITDPNGCAFSSTTYAYSVGIESKTNNLWSVYPNPANHTINIILSNTLSSDHIEIYDISGRLIDNYSLNGINTQELNISNYYAGTYLILLRSNKGILTKKFIKK